MSQYETYETLDDIPGVPVEESTAIKLADAGLSPEVISYAVGLPLSRVRTLIISKRPGPVPLIDEKLADGVRTLATAALREAHLILEYGPTEQKMTIIKAMLGGLSRHVGSTAGSEQEEARSEFEAMLVEMRTEGIPERDRVVTDDEILDVEAYDAEATTAASPFDD